MIVNPDIADLYEPYIKLEHQHIVSLVAIAGDEDRTIIEECCKPESYPEFKVRLAAMSKSELEEYARYLTDASYREEEDRKLKEVVSQRLQDRFGL